jgi:hypothetical protein
MSMQHDPSLAGWESTSGVGARSRRPPTGAHANWLGLQRSIGNRAVADWLRADASAAPSDLAHQVLASPGEPLAAAQRRRFELGFRQSLQHVRVHRGGLAAASADALNAEAYSVGQHIVLGAARAPGSPGHEQTLAHEVAHVVQQPLYSGSSTIPVTLPHAREEREAEHAASSLMAGRSAPRLSRVPLQLSRQARLTIVDHESGLTDKEFAVIVKEAKQALKATTQRATDKRVKAGVDVTVQTGLKDIDKLVQRGDVIVYVIGAKKGDKTISNARMLSLVRDIVTGQKLGDPKKFEERSKLIAGDLAETVDAAGNVSGQHEYDPGASVSIVNVDLYSNRNSPGALRAIAGDIIHESVGHRAHGRGYHHPKDKGVMSKDVRASASQKDVLFQSDEHDVVNAFLKTIIDDPNWNK